MATKTKADLLSELETFGVTNIPADATRDYLASLVEAAVRHAAVVDGEAVELGEDDLPLEVTPEEADALIAAEATQEIVVRERDHALPAVHALPGPGEWEATMTMARTIANTPFVPATYRGQPEAVVAAILYGREIGIGPMQALRQIHMIDGRPALSAELMMAQMRRGGLVVVASESTGDRAWIHARRQDTGEQAEVEWTYAEAEQISQKGKRLVEKDNWRNYRADMLWARCVGRLGRRLGSDLLGGMVYASEEVADWDEGGYGGAGYSTPSASSGRPVTSDGVELRADAPLGWSAISTAMKEIDAGMDWQVWTSQAMVARVGKPKLADLDDVEQKDLGIRVANGVARLVVALGGRDFPPPSRGEIQAAFAHADAIDVRLDGPTTPLDPDEAAEQAAADAVQPPAAHAASDAGAGTPEPETPSDAALGTPMPKTGALPESGD